MNNALKITISPPTGKAAVANFQTRCGLLADTTLGDKDAFNCVEHRAAGVELRWFQAGADMDVRALTTPVEIAPGLTAQVVPESDAPASIPLSGPGSTLALQMRQSPGFKSASLPTLPHAWANAIKAAGRN